ncbi:MAG: L-lactate permease [Ideonella sp.]|nr:L-lactate permease [Ideonella sp.]
MAAVATPALLAAAPVLLILGLMLGLRWSAGRAGLAALALAAVLAHAAFGFGDLATAPGPAQAWAGVGAEGAFLALTILWILWPALALHRLQQDSGAIDALRGGLSRLTSKPGLQALLVGWLLGRCSSAGCSRCSSRGRPASARRSRWPRRSWSGWALRPCRPWCSRCSAMPPASRSARWVRRCSRRWP